MNPLKVHAWKNLHDKQFKICMWTQQLLIAPLNNTPSHPHFIQVWMPPSGQTMSSGNNPLLQTSLPRPLICYLSGVIFLSTSMWSHFLWGWYRWSRLVLLFNKRCAVSWSLKTLEAALHHANTKRRALMLYFVNCYILLCRSYLHCRLTACNY